MNAPITLSSPSGATQLSGQDEFDLLNQDQQKAVSEIFRFLMSNEREFMVSGPAGTGKTHLMKYVMRHTLANYRRACELLGQPYIDFTIELTATTNKAAAVLSASTGYVANTVHSFLNLKVRDNYETGAAEVRPTPSWVVHERVLLFIDEASMVDAALHDYIRKGTDKTCKIIYLGGHCQSMGPGNRNNQLIRYALALVDAGFGYQQVEEALLSFNSRLKSGLPEDELRSTILVTVARKIHGK